MSKVAKRHSSTVKTGSTLTQQSENNSGLISILLVLTAVACLLCTLIFDKTKDINNFGVTVAGLCIVAVAGVFLAVNKKLTTQNTIVLLFAAGFIIRLDYVLYTVVSTTARSRQHDLYDFGSGKGHAGYIEHFYENGFKLADFDPTTKAQFYHPPLYHFLSALWMRLLTTFGMSYERAVCSIQYLTLFYSCCCMLITERILNALNLRRIGKIVAFSIVAFHPTFIILAGSVNNDILSVLFILLSIYTTVRWYKDSTIKNILYIALSVGLGMMTKLSVALVAPPIAFVFLIKFIQSKKDKFDYFGQYCVFGCLCIPLGMWFSLRNFILYKVPFNYVPRLADTSDQYVGNYSVFERLFDFSYHPFENVFLNRIATDAEYYEYNPIVSFIKTSLFGEYNYANNNADILLPCGILLVINIFLIVLSVAAMIFCIVKKNKFIDNNLKLFFVFYQVLIFVNFIIFSFQYPHNCSMDYRYMVPTCVIGAAFIGMMIEHPDIEKNGEETVLSFTTKYTTLAAVGAFSLFSIIVYVMLGMK